MATVIAANDVLEFRVGCTQGNQVAINVLHFEASAVLGLSRTVAQAAADFDAMVAPVIKPLLTANASYYGVRAQKIRPTPLSIPAVSSAAPGVGTSGAASLPFNVSGIITKKTAFAGRGFRGRVYVPFPSEQDNDDAAGVPNAAYGINLAALGAILLTQWTSGVLANTVTFRPVLWNRTLRTINYIDGGQARLKWANQRRRGAYGQANVLPPF